MPKKNTIIVTGGSTGIGANLCEYYLTQGYQVISFARAKANIKHERLKQVQVDLMDEKATAIAIDDICSQHEVTHFVHNAGVICPNLLEDVRLSELRDLTQLHLGSAIQIMQSILPSMRKNQFGRVVLMSSRGILGLPTRTSYAATKAGMLGMARTWALEFAAQGITVNVVAPGPIQTPMFYGAVENGNAREQQIAASIPVKRLGRVDDITRAVAFFTDPENGFVTGQTLYVCGGASIGSLTI